MNDGQQRLVTTTLIFALLAHKLSRGRPKETVALRSRLYNLCFYDFQEIDLPDPDELLPFELAPRITAPSEDISTFGKLLRKMELAGNTKLIRAWLIIDKWLCEPKRNNNDWRIEFALQLIDNVTMVHLKVPESFDLHAIFETLNSRGKSLDQIDLFKNYCMHRVEGHSTNYKKNIIESFNEVERNLRRKKKVAEYVRCFMQSKFGHLPEAYLFRSLRNKIEKEFGSSGKPRKFSKFIGELGSDYMRMYEFYKRPDNYQNDIESLLSNTHQSHYSELIVSLQEISRYSVAFPAIQSLFVIFLKTKIISVEEFIKSCKSLSSFMVRVSLTHGSVKPSLYEIELADLALSINKDPSRAFQKVITTLKKLDSKGSGVSILNDSIVEKTLVQLSIKSNPKCKKLLYAMENGNIDVQPSDEKETKVMPILPYSPIEHANWRGFKEAGVEWCNKVGNKVLLEKNLAENIISETNGNQTGLKNFKIIKSILSNSKFKFTSKVCNEKKWNPDAVYDRQVEIARKAVQHWGFPVEKKNEI